MYFIEHTGEPGREQVVYFTLMPKIGIVCYD